MNRARLRTQQVVDIRKQHAAGYAIGELARAYGRTVRTIGRVVKGESYGHIDGDAIDAAPPLPRNINWSNVTGTNPQVRQAPAPKTIYHLGSAQDGPRCGFETAGYQNKFAETPARLEEWASRKVNVCQLCVLI